MQSILFTYNDYNKKNMTLELECPCGHIFRRNAEFGTTPTRVTEMHHGS